MYVYVCRVLGQLFGSLIKLPLLFLPIYFTKTCSFL